MTAIPHPMTTTAFVLDGHAIQRTLGVVRGVTVRSRSVLGTIGASLQTLVGGNITLLTELCERTRADAFELMLDHARQLGANAVVGIRYDATEGMQGVTGVLCYGPAERGGGARRPPAPPRPPPPPPPRGGAGSPRRSRTPRTRRDGRADSGPRP